MDRFHECFGDVPDPRADNAQHELVEVLFIALLASLCGAKGCSDMAEFGRAKEPLLRPILTLSHGIPSHDTFSRVFRMLDPVAFEEAFRRFSRIFLLSKRFSAAKLLELVRTHWSIENTLHWTLDVTLQEDLARNRKDNGPANLAVLRRLALNIARAHPDTKTSLRRKLLRAGWDDNFLFNLIRHMR